MPEMNEPVATDIGPLFHATREAPRVIFEGEPEPFDHFLGDADLAAASQSLAHGDWERANALEVMGERLRILGEQATDLTGMQTWVENAPSPVAHTTMGFAILSQGWASAASDPVTFEQFLSSADSYFATALAADPHFVHAYEGRIDVACLRRDVATARQYFEAAHAIEPFSTGATYSMTKALAPAFGGSNDDMLAFARWVVEEAPVGTPAAGVIAEAHFRIATSTLNDHGLDPFLHMIGPEAQKDLEAGLRSIMDGLEGLREPAPLAYVRPLNMLLFFMRVRSAVGLVYGKRGWGLLDKRPTWMPWAFFSQDAGNPRNFFSDYRYQRLLTMQKFDEEIAAKKAATAS